MFYSFLAAPLGAFLLAALPASHASQAFTHSVAPVHQPTQTIGKDGGATGAFTYSADPKVAARQRTAKQTVETYQRYLNTSNTKSIVALFAPDAVIKWNTKRTVVGRAGLPAPYEALFKTTKFNTDFQYDAVDVYDNVALVRTHHPKGQAESNLKTGAKTLDFNRELFVLKQNGAGWQIIFYSFNAQSQQGEQ